MKTLNSLLALALLVSSVAPVCAMENEPKVDATVKTEEVKTEAQAKSFVDTAKAFAGEKAAAVKGFYAYNPEAKVASFAKYGVTVAAVAAVVGGLVYLFTGDESSEDEATEEVAPVDEPVKTVVEAPVVAPAPAVKAQHPVRKPTRGKKNRCGKTTRVKRGGCRTGCR